MATPSSARRLVGGLLVTSALLVMPTAAVALPPFPPSDPSLPRLTVVPCGPVVLHDRPCRITVFGPPGQRVSFFSVSIGEALRPWTTWSEHSWSEPGPALDARGRAAFDGGFGSSSAMYASVPGGPPSDVATVRVKRQVTLDVARVARRVYRFTGRSSPGQTPLSVTLARVLPGGRLVGVARAALVDTGLAHRVDVRLRPGTYFFTVLTGPTNLFFVQGNSRIYGLVVPAD
jgi:hypothetical protein